MKKVFKKYGNELVIIGIILLLASSRLVAHPFNFTPFTAIALFSGCYLKKNYGFFLPLLALLIGDLFIGFYDVRLMFFVYISLGVAFLVGRFYARHKKWYNLILAIFASSAIFFMVTNFSVWLVADWYPRTLKGLNDCFVAAVPFFRNSVAGDLIYSLAIFSVFEFFMVHSANKQKISKLTAQ